MITTMSYSAMVIVAAIAAIIMGFVVISVKRAK